MQRQVVCALTDWLGGVTAGSSQWSVNARLAAMPAELRDPLDNAALTPVPLIVDPFRYGPARDFTAKPPTLPALYVLPDGPVTMDGVVGPVDRRALSVAASIRVVMQNPNDAASQRYAAYVQHAIAQSLDAFLAETDEARAARQREGVWIVTANMIAVGDWFEAVGEAMAVAVTAIDFDVRDRRPRG